jgi:hypothetical protein
MSYAIITGVFTLLAALMTLAFQGHQQRGQAQDERFWNRRADTYVAMLQYQGSGMLEDFRGAASSAEWLVRDDLTAKASAFASDEVWNLGQQSAQSYSALGEYVQEEWPEWNGGEESLAVEEKMEADREFRSLRQARADAAKRLAEQVRNELDSQRRRRRSLTHTGN